MTDDDTAELTSHEDTMLLTEVPSGKTCKLVRISRRRRENRGFGKHRKRVEEGKETPQQGRGRFHGGRRILRRLLDLGITTGCEFQVIQGGDSGPVLVQVRGTRVALGHGLASKLLVKVVN